MWVELIVTGLLTALVIAALVGFFWLMWRHEGLAVGLLMGFFGLAFVLTIAVVIHAVVFGS